MAANTCYYPTSRSCALMGIMDRLWFHQVILFSQHPYSNSLHGHNNLNPNEDSLHPVTKTCDEVKGEASSCMLMMHPESDIKQSAYPIIIHGNYRIKEGSYKSEEESELRPSREITVSFGDRDEGTRSESKSLHKTMSCRSFEDLEMEEVKGFMDLGFIFEKEHLNRQMISVIPGLQRLGLVEDGNHEDKGDKKGNPAIEGGRIRPYLSEAWLVRRPDSPLLNLWVLRKVDAAADMKKILQHWAKSVASAIQRQS